MVIEIKYTQLDTCMDKIKIDWLIEMEKNEVNTWRTLFDLWPVITWCCQQPIIKKRDTRKKRERERGRERKKERKSGMIWEGIKERERMRYKKRNNICHSKYFIEICLQELFYIFSGCYTLYVLSDLPTKLPFIWSICFKISSKTEMNVSMGVYCLRSTLTY